MRRATLFLIEWRQVDRAPAVVTNPLTGSSAKCSQVTHIPPSGFVNISSPGYPGGYADNLNCSWQFDTDPGWHLGIFFTDLDLEETPSCDMDRVLVSSGEGGGPKWKLAHTVCHANQTYNPPFATSNYMLVNFLSDWRTNGTGFQATVLSMCGGELSGPSGRITSPFNQTHLPIAYGSDTSCEWTVTGRRGRTLAVTIHLLSVPPDAGLAGSPGTCGNSYLMLKNGGSAASPLLGDGKYCGTRPPASVPETSGNQLFVKLHVHDDNARFVLTYEEKADSCGQEVRLTEASPSQIITSPRHPSVAPPHVECVFLVTAPAGRRLRLDFEDRFDLMASPGCRKSGVEVRDGGTEGSPLVDIFCATMPSTIESTGNMLRVRYFNDVDEPGDGFRANVSIATCGGTIRGATGVVSSPGYPLGYPPNTRCEWRLVVRPTATMTLSFRDMHIAGFAARRCRDTLTITSLISEGESKSTNETDTDLGTLCGTTLPANVTSLSNEVRLVFQSNMSSPISYRGFSLRFTTNHNECGGTLETVTGTIRSPGYPSRLPRQRCAWTIKAPEGRRVSLTFRDVDLVRSTSYSLSQRIWLFHGMDETVPMKSLNYTLTPGTKFESTSNTLVIVLYSMVSTSNRGFIIDYDTSKPTLCGGQLPTNMSAPLGPPDANVTSYLCSWRLDAPRGPTEQALAQPATKTLAVVIKLSGIYRFRTPCHKYTTRVLLQKADNTAIGRVCTSTTEPITFLSPYPNNMLVVSLPMYQQSMNFSIEYSWHDCGGVLVSPAELTSPGFPGTYPPNTHCAWKIDFDEGQQVLVSFDTWSLRADSQHDYVEIHNGDSSKAPKLGPLRGSGAIEPLHSMGSSLWIEFHSGPAMAQPPPGKGFKITFSTTARACGGILHGKSGEFSTPGFPRNYPAAAECVWEVRAETGFRVSLSFVDRFHVQERDGAAGSCSDDYVEMLDYDEARREWTPVGGRLCGRTPPAEPLESSGSWLRLVFRSDSTGAAEGFKVRWKVVCGFSRKLTPDAPRGEILSPGYPLGYSAFLNCTYELRAPAADQVILARFTNFSVEGAQGCVFDNVTLIRTSEEDSSVPWVFNGGPHRSAYCDRRQPPALIRVRNKLLFTFQTDRYVQDMGFRLVYELDMCHQEVTRPGLIEPPREGLAYTHQANCSWNITAPAGSLVFIRFTQLETELSYDCFSDSVSVFDGPSANESALLGRFCGNLTHNLPSVRSTGRSVLLRWVTDVSVGGRGFVAVVRFQSAKCVEVHRSRDPDRNRGTALARGEPLELAAGETVRVEVTRFDDADCDWAVTVPSGSNVRLEAIAAGGLDAMQRCSSNRTRDPCQCGYLQVADGLDAYAETMGRFCAARLPPALTSSDRSMYLRLSAEQHRGAVSLTLRAVPSVCGVTLFALNKSQELVIRSPRFPSRPPPLVRCVWNVDLQNNAAVINLTTVDLDGPSHCTDKDSPASHIDTGRIDITKGAVSAWSSNSKVHVGNQLLDVMVPGLHVVDMYADRTLSFCGKERPPPIALQAYTSGFQVTYHSGASPTGKGFELRVKSGTACPPASLTEPSGTLNFGQDEERCTVVISATANQTISIFLGESSYIPPTEGCADGGVEVRDGRELSSPLLGRLCSYDMTRGFSSSGPAMLIKYWRKDGFFSQVEAYYTTTDNGPGCGGRIHQEMGVFSSPMYPAPYRNASVCRWDIETPGAKNPVIAFKAFDLGPNTSCESDNVEIFDVDSDGKETKRARFCGQEKPAVVHGNTRHMVLKYTTSIRNGGTGWLVEFKGLGSGETIRLN